LAGIGLLSMIHDKAQKIIDGLTRRGEVWKDEAKDSVDRLVEGGEDVRQSLRKLIHDEVKSALDEIGQATKQDLQDMVDKKDTLGKHGGM